MGLTLKSGRLFGVIFFHIYLDFKVFRKNVPSGDDVYPFLGLNVLCLFITYLSTLIKPYKHSEVNLGVTKIKVIKELKMLR